VTTRENNLKDIGTEDLAQLQLEHLQSTLNRAYKNVPFYKKRFDGLGIDLSTLDVVRDLSKLPFTTRQDLADNYPYDMFAVPLRDIVRISPSAGTTAKPFVVGFTRGDLKARQRITARFLTVGGTTETDIVQICLNPGLSSWGRALKEGAEDIGASVMPMTHMSTAKQLLAMKDYRTSVLITTPSYAMHMLRVMQTIELDADRLALKAVFVVGGTIPTDWRRHLEKDLGVTLTAGYGLSDITAPAIGFECSDKSGFHISEDHFILEIVNPESGQPCSPGQEGEIVLTTLTGRAFPLVRFRTGDLASVKTGPCPCGTTFSRISEITGATGQVLTVSGIKMHPAQIEQVLQALPGPIPPRFVVRLYREDYLDRVEIWLEMTEGLFSDEVKRVEDHLKELRRRVFQMLGLEVSIKLMESATLDADHLPASRVIDER